MPRKQLPPKRKPSTYTHVAVSGSRCGSSGLHTNGLNSLRCKQPYQAVRMATAAPGNIRKQPNSSTMSTDTLDHRDMWAAVRRSMTCTHDQQRMTSALIMDNSRCQQRV